MSHTDKPIPAATSDEYTEQAWGLMAPGSKIEPFMIPRAKVGANHVKFAMKYAGVCHSDVHMGKK